MAVTPEQLRTRLVQLAGRYLERVTKEQARLRALIDSAAGGDLDEVREIEALTHRMRGSGALLHFDEISGCAGELERMAAGFIASGRVESPRMLVVFERLQVAIERACANRATP